MSRQSGSDVDRPAWTVTWPFQEPLVEETVDVSVAGIRMTSSKILAHQIHAGLEQVQCRPEGFGD
jgi:hypothetical protein